MAHQFLRLDEVTARVGISRSSVYRLVNLKQFPQPVKIGVKAVAWLDEEIEQWCSDRIAASRP